LFVQISAPMPRYWQRMLVALVPIFAVTLLLRVPRGEAMTHFWAEDGAVFYSQATRDGCAAVTQGYAGYGHLLPRLVACAAAQVPIADAPAFMAVSAAVLASLVSVLAVHLGASVTGSRAVGVVAGGALVLSPMAKLEVLDAVCNVQWYLPLPLIWTVLAVPRRRRAALGLAAFAAIAVATAPLTVLLLPLVILRMWKLRSAPGRDPIPWGFLVGFAFQFAMILANRSQRPPSPDRPGALGLANATATRLLMGWAGPTMAPSLFRVMGWGFAVLIGIALIFSSIGACIRVDHRGHVAVIAVASLVLVLFPLVFQWTPQLETQGRDLRLLFGGRYAVSPLVMLLCVPLVGIRWRPMRAGAQEGSAFWERSGRLCATALLLLAAIAAAADFKGGQARGIYPAWPDQLAAARAFCSGPGRPAAATLVADPGLQFSVPCARVVS
jgi:hypothetical protein